jgi:hypothetical protein
LNNFIFAISKLGAILVPVNTFLKENELSYILEDSGSSILIASNIQVNDIYRKYPPHFPPYPKGIYETNICPYSGKYPGPNCPKIGEYFIEGTGPNGTCDGVHVKFFSLSHWIRTKQLLFKIQKNGISSISNKEMKFLKRYGVRVFESLYEMIRICEKIYREGENSLSDTEKEIISPLYSSELPKNF